MQLARDPEGEENCPNPLFNKFNPPKQIQTARNNQRIGWSRLRNEHDKLIIQRKARAMKFANERF